ncbi:MAG: hypothetical protein BZY85_07350, partial [SAR202 cluster bacterium MP-SAtl-SRR3965592-G1]
MDETPRKVLVITPHPDDADFWCAGTIAKWIGAGATVRYVLCTDGGKGTTDPNVSSDDLSKIREQEQADAVEILGVQELVMLHHPDGFLEDDHE